MTDETHASNSSSLTIVDGGGADTASGEWKSKAHESRDEALFALLQSHETHKAQLAALAGTVDMFPDERGGTWARLDVDGHKETLALRGRAFRSWLVNRHHELLGEVASRSSVNDALQLVEAQAGQSGEVRRLDNRLSWRDGQLWYDLADRRWRAVRIDEREWTVVDLPPPHFRRYSHQKPQPEPERGGDLVDDLLPLLNLPREVSGLSDEEVLYLIWLVCGFLPQIPRPALVPYGSQGSGKTFLTRLSRAIIDPSQVPAPRTPRGDKEWAQVADHHAVLALDNLTNVNERTSDALCRAVTGDGLSKRKLYTDDDDIIFTFRRLVILNGISAPAQKSDLLDRSLLMLLPSIPQEERRPEQDLWRAFESRRPAILGAVFSALSAAIATVDSVHLDTLPRMADFTVWGTAVADALGIGGRRFRAAYRRNRHEASRRAVESHPLGEAVLQFMDSRAHWKGTPTDLLNRLNQLAQTASIDRRAELWPKSADSLTKRLFEIEPNLRSEGIAFDRGRTGSARHLTLEREEHDESA